MFSVYGNLFPREHIETRTHAYSSTYWNGNFPPNWRFSAWGAAHEIPSREYGFCSLAHLERAGFGTEAWSILKTASDVSAASQADLALALGNYPGAPLNEKLIYEVLLK